MLRNRIRFDGPYTITWVECAECGKPLASAQDWSKCRRQHVYERMAAATPGSIERLMCDYPEAFGLKRHTT